MMETLDLFGNGEEGLNACGVKLDVIKLEYLSSESLIVNAFFLNSVVPFCVFPSTLCPSA